MKGNEVALSSDPCPWCDNEKQIIHGLEKLCNQCFLPPERATQKRKLLARRTKQGWLICMGCNEANEYAEPDECGKFKCTSCKLREELA